MKKPFIVTITGPSCAGKTTLESRLRMVGFAAVVSTTTRTQRFGEKDGETYYFVNRTRFNAMQEAGEFVESIEFGGNLYGVTAAEVQRIAAMNRPIVVVVEPNGRDQVIAYCEKRGWASYSVFICNPDEVIAKRFLMRLRNEIEGVKNQIGIIGRYAERMAQMMTTERAWIAEAFLQDRNYQDYPYDAIYPHFDEDNDSTVVESILKEFVVHSELNREKAA